MKITNIEPEQSERKAEFLSLLRSLGGIAIEEIDYGFIITLNGILVDCEPCVQTNGLYKLEGLALGTCPWEKQGNIKC